MGKGKYQEGKDKMVFNPTKKEILRRSYRIDKGIMIYYPSDIYQNPEESDKILYKPKNVVHNALERYFDEKKEISLLIFSFGSQLYILPEFSFMFPNFFDSSVNKLLKLGLKERNMGTPFSKGAIPANEGWILNYRILKDRAEQLYHIFEKEMSGDF